ncbi:MULTISPECIES: AraC family transcriptional regulator [Rhodopseudomonas]|nr:MULTISPECIES: AraC family transcriptional regulator [Rhodopseudomonas]MDF3813316.1 AraC family transcriptional regulator [Rhodopseudomonas sp. BAL398]WOK17219.1 AraC family transcriptional regulator [Rhodopseudomonas sp. BAL398]
MPTAGLDADAVLRRAGLDPAELRKPKSRLTQAQFARLVSTIARLSQDEFWGLCGRPIKPGTFRMLCHILIGCRDLGEAISQGCRFYHLMVDDFAIRQTSDRRVARIWISDQIADPARRRMALGAIIFFVFGLMCWLVGRKLPLHYVQHAFPEASYGADLRLYYQAPLYFDQSRTEIAFDAGLLSLPIMPDEQRLSRFLASMPAALLVRYRDEMSFSERVRSLLQRNLAEDLSLEDVAAKLSITQQTLRRRLQDESDLGFRDLKDRVRSAAAVNLLQYSQSPIDEIAAALGFSEVSTFHRAFRRWTGRTPGEFRHAPDDAG